MESPTSRVMMPAAFLTLDCDCALVDTVQEPIADPPLPDPNVVPPDQTNM